MGEFFPIAMIALVIAAAITALMLRNAQRRLPEETVSRFKIKLVSGRAAELADKLRAASDEARNSGRQVVVDYCDEEDDEMFRFLIDPGADGKGADGQ